MSTHTDEKRVQESVEKIVGDVVVKLFDDFCLELGKPFIDSVTSRIMSEAVIPVIDAQKQQIEQARGLLLRASGGVHKRDTQHLFPVFCVCDDGEECSCGWPERYRKYLEHKDSCLPNCPVCKWNAERDAFISSSEAGTQGEETENKLGTFTPEHGEPITVTFLPPTEGRFSPVEEAD